MLIIDRFEGEYAVCEEISADGDGDRSLPMRNIPKVFLPRGIREGDCLLLDSAGSWVVDRQETMRRRRLTQDLLNNLYH